MPSGLDFKNEGSADMEEARNRYAAAMRFFESNRAARTHVIVGDLNETRSAADASVSFRRRHGRVMNAVCNEYTDAVRYLRPVATHDDRTYSDPAGRWSRLDYVWIRQNALLPAGAVEIEEARCVDMNNLRSRHRAVTVTLRLRDSQIGAEYSQHSARFVRVGSSNRGQREMFADCVSRMATPIAALRDEIEEHADLQMLGEVSAQLSQEILRAARQHLGTTSGAFRKTDRLLIKWSECRKRARHLQRELLSAQAASDRAETTAKAHAIVRQVGLDPGNTDAGQLVLLLDQAVSTLRKRARKLRRSEPTRKMTARVAAATMNAPKAPGIHAVMDEHGTVHTQRDDVHAVLLKHFAQLVAAKDAVEDPANQNDCASISVRESSANLADPMSCDEVRAVLCSKACRWVTAAGADGLTEGILRVAATYCQSQKLLTVLTSLYNRMLKIADVPAELKQLIFYPIIKRRGKLSVKDVRPITLYPAVARILYKILAAREQEAAEKSAAYHPAQFAFLRGRGALDAVRLRQAAINYAADHSLPVYSVLYDFAGAYDSVAFSTLETALTAIGHPAPYVRFHLQRHKGTSIAVQTVHGRSEQQIPMQKGIRQGDPCACLHWNAVLNPLLRSLNAGRNADTPWKTTEAMGSARAERESGFSFGRLQVSAIAFADDLCTLDSTPQGLRKSHYTILSFCVQNNLKINGDKCVMQVSLQNAPQPEPLKIGAMTIKMSDEGISRHRYLGVVAQIDGRNDGQDLAVTQMVGRYAQTVRSLGRQMGAIQAVKFVNVHLVAKLTYHASTVTLDQAGLNSLDSNITSAVSSALALGTRIPIDVLACVADLRLPSQIVRAAIVTECLLLVNSGLPHAETIIESGRFRAAAGGWRLAQHSAATASLSLVPLVRTNARQRSLLFDAEVGVPFQQSSITLSVGGQEVGWKPESNSLFYDSAEPSVATLLISSSVLQADEANSTAEVSWCAVVVDDAAIALRREDLERRDAAGMRARAQLPVIGRTSTVYRTTGATGVLLAAMVAGVLTFSCDMRVRVKLCCASEHISAIRKAFEQKHGGSLRKEWKSEHAAYLSLARAVAQKRTSHGGEMEILDRGDLSAGEQELVETALSLVRQGLIERGELPSPLLATRRAALAVSTPDGQQIPVPGAWRAAMRQELRKSWWIEVQAKSLIVQQLHLTEQDIKRVRRVVDSINDYSKRVLAFRWLIHLFLPGRHVFAVEHYGELIPWPHCACAEPVHNGQLLHYASCPEMAERRQTLMTTICDEYDDQALQAMLRRMCQDSANNARICFGLPWERHAHHIALSSLHAAISVEFLARLLLDR